MKTIKLLLLFSLSLFLINSCTKTDPEPKASGNYENGFFVVNEGHWGSGNASITYISDDYTKVEQNVFKEANGENLGDVAQSIFMHEEKAYIIVNSSDKIEIVNRYTMKKIKTLTGNEIKNPRYMVAYNGKGYLSNWGVLEDPNDDTLVIIDLTTDTVTATIPVGFVPNNLVVVGDKLYVEIQGTWSSGNENKVNVIDLTNNTLIKTIEVGVYPHGILTHNNKVYVLSNDNIAEIDTALDVVKRSIPLSDTGYFGGFAKHLNAIYYGANNNIYTWNINDSAVPTTEEISFGKSIYGMTVFDGKLYVNSFEDTQTGESKLSLYNLSNNELIQEIPTGIYSNGVVFN